MDTALHISEEYLRSIDVHTVLPQQEPFVMIGTLTGFSKEHSETETEIKETNIFVDDGKLSAAGMLENIAQTCAARIGFYNKYILHKDVQVGFIGAVRNFTILGLPEVGSMITTRIDILQDVFGMTLATAEIKCGEDMMAIAEIKLSVKDVE